MDGWVCAPYCPHSSGAFSQMIYRYPKPRVSMPKLMTCFPPYSLAPPPLFSDSTSIICSGWFSVRILYNSLTISPRPLLSVLSHVLPQLLPPAIFPRWSTDHLMPGILTVPHPQGLFLLSASLLSNPYVNLFSASWWKLQRQSWAVEGEQNSIRWILGAGRVVQTLTTQSVVHGLETLATLGSLLERQTLRSHLRPKESESAF